MAWAGLVLGAAVAVVAGAVVLRAQGGQRVVPVTTGGSAGSGVPTSVMDATTLPLGRPPEATPAPPILGVVPLAFEGHCQTVSPADRVSIRTDDEVGCVVKGVPGSDADYVGYDRFATGSLADSYFSSLLGINGMTVGAGDCATLELSGTARDGKYCQGDYIGGSGTDGLDLVFEGSDLDFGTSSHQRSSANQAGAACSSTSAGRGVTAIVWTSPGDAVVGYAFDCARSDVYGRAMLRNLVGGSYALND